MLKFRNSLKSIFLQNMLSLKSDPSGCRPFRFDFFLNFTLVTHYIKWVLLGHTVPSVQKVVTHFI